MRRSVLLAASWLVLLAFAYQDVGAEQMLDGRFLSPAYRADPVAMDFATAELISLNQPPDEMDFPPTYVSHSEAHRCGFYAGAELVIVKPYWEDEVDTLRSVLNPGDPQESRILEQLDPEYSCSLSPRIYVGYRNCDGFGGRVRYWLFNESAKPLNIETVDGPITLARTLKANLNVQAVDLEATKMLLDSMFSLELSGGVRYGRTKVEASLTRQELFGDTVLSTNSFVGRTTFEGVGPTVSTEACHRLGGTPFNFLGNIRGSLLFGQSNSYNEEIGGVPGKKINHGDADVVPVIEVQMGAEYVKMIGNGRLSLRALMEGQWWGVATPGAGFARDLENAPISGGVDLFTTGRDIGFFGVTAGIIYEH